MSEYNFTVAGGSSVKLLTEGKYLDRNIVVTAEGGSDGAWGEWLFQDVVCLDENLALITAVPVAGKCYVLFNGGEPAGVTVCNEQGMNMAADSTYMVGYIFAEGIWKCRNAMHEVMGATTISVRELLI